MSSSTSNDRDVAVPPTGRRKLFTGFAATLIVVSRPAQAGLLCRTPSAFGSLTASGPGRKDFVCNGRTPGYWKQEQHFSAWPAPYVPVTGDAIGAPPATLFHRAGFDGSQFAGKTLLDVLSTGGNAGGYTALARHVAAALLNAASGKTPVLTVSAVLNLWNEYVARGYFEPTAGVRWNEEQIVTYLLTTMPV